MDWHPGIVTYAPSYTAGGQSEVQGDDDEADGDGESDDLVQREIQVCPVATT